MYIKEIGNRVGHCRYTGSVWLADSRCRCLEKTSWVLTSKIDWSVYLQFLIYWDMCSEALFLSPSTHLTSLQSIQRELPCQQSSTPPHKYGPAKTWVTYLHICCRNKERKDRNNDNGCITVLVLKNCVASGDYNPFFFLLPALYQVTRFNECISFFSHPLLFTQ